MKLSALVGTATAAAFGIVLCASAPVSAKGGGPKPKPAAPKTHGKPAGSVAPKGGAPKGAPKGGAPKAGAPKGGAAAKAPKGAAKATAPKGSAKAPKAAKGTGATDPTLGKKAASDPTLGGTRGTDPTTNLSHAQQLLTKNANLRAQMESRLPAGTDVIAAASDFRNLGQFVAAVNASHNQGYDFLQLKALMTGPNALSLGQAKKQLRAGTTVPGPGPDPTLPADPTLPGRPTSGTDPTLPGSNGGPTGGTDASLPRPSNGPSGTDASLPSGRAPKTGRKTSQH